MMGCTDTKMGEKLGAVGASDSDVEFWSNLSRSGQSAVDRSGVTPTPGKPRSTPIDRQYVEDARRAAWGLKTGNFERFAESIEKCLDRLETLERASAANGDRLPGWAAYAFRMYREAAGMIGDAPIDAFVEGLVCATVRDMVRELAEAKSARGPDDEDLAEKLRQVTAERDLAIKGEATWCCDRHGWIVTDPERYADDYDGGLDAIRRYLRNKGESNPETSGDAPGLNLVNGDGESADVMPSARAIRVKVRSSTRKAGVRVLDLVVVDNPPESYLLVFPDGSLGAAYMGDLGTLTLANGRDVDGGMSLTIDGRDGALEATPA